MTVTAPAPAPVQNLILIDWLSFSLSNIDRDSMIANLGFGSLPWQKGLGSKYRYAERWQFDGVSIHWTDKDDLSHNPGVFVEMSGQGCRDFETYSQWDFYGLIKYILECQGNITRIDIAYDDFSGLIDIKEMFRAADNQEFRCRLNSFSLHSDHPDQDPDHAGRSVCHGSRSSRTFFRCYDKRSERRAWEECCHWVRFEIQLRNENAMGFCQSSGSIGSKFFGVVSQYLDYVVPCDDSNKSRWPLAAWWSAFLDDAQSISVFTKKDVEYNRDRLERYVLGQAINAIRCLDQLGHKEFLSRLHYDDEGRPLPALSPKYQRLIDQEKALRERSHDQSLINQEKAFIQRRHDQIFSDIFGGVIDE